MIEMPALAATDQVLRLLRGGLDRPGMDPLSCLDYRRGRPGVGVADEGLDQAVGGIVLAWWLLGDQVQWRDRLLNTWLTRRPTRTGGMVIIDLRILLGQHAYAGSHRELVGLIQITGDDRRPLVHTGAVDSPALIGRLFRSWYHSPPHTWSQVITSAGGVQIRETVALKYLVQHALRTFEAWRQTRPELTPGRPGLGSA